MLSVKECRESYYYNSGQISNITRQIALAGIVVIWVLSNCYKQFTIASYFLWPSILILASLFFDFFQYLSSTIIWGVFAWCKEKKGFKDDELLFINPKLNWFGFFLSKSN